MENETPFERWWLSLPLDLRQMYGSQGIGPAQAAWDAQTKRIDELERELLRVRVDGAEGHRQREIWCERQFSMTEFKHTSPKTAFRESNEVVLRFSHALNLDGMIDGFNAFLKALGYESQVEVKE